MHIIKGKCMSFRNKGKKNPKEDNEIKEDWDQESEEQDVKKMGGGFSFLGNFFFLITLIIIACIGWLVYQTWVPQDLTKLKGYRQAAGAINIPELLDEACKKNAALTLTEEDINRYVASTLKASQSGFMSPFIKPNGVAVKLHDGYMEVFIERQLSSNYLQTISLFVTIVQLEDPLSRYPITNLVYKNGLNQDSYIAQGGTLGQLVVPQGYINLILPAYEKLAMAYKDLLSSIVDNGRIIRVRNGYVDIMPGKQLL